MVDGALSRFTEAERCRPGSNVRYRDSIKYCDDNGDRRFSCTSRLFASTRLVKSATVSGSCPLRIKSASACCEAAEGTGTSAGRYRLRNCSTHRLSADESLVPATHVK